MTKEIEQLRIEYGDIKNKSFNDGGAGFFSPDYTKWLEERLSCKDSVMPNELTAENGAKGLLIGEFYEEAEAYDEMEGDYIIKVPVEWSTIKDIYKKIVDHYTN